MTGLGGSFRGAHRSDACKNGHKTKAGQPKNFGGNSSMNGRKFVVFGGGGVEGGGEGWCFLVFCFGGLGVWGVGGGFFFCLGLGGGGGCFWGGFLVWGVGCRTLSLLF